MKPNGRFAVSDKYVQALIVLLVAIMAITFSIGKDAIQLNRMGDAAIFEQIIENISAGKGAVSNVFANTQNYIDRGYAFLTPDVIARMKLESPPNSEKDMLQFHAYYVLFLLAPLVNFLISSFVLSLAQSISFFGLLLAAWFFVFRQTRSTIGSFLFMFTILLNPNWVGGIDGQFYPDRIFVVAGFILCYLIYQGAPLWRILAAAIFVGLINERAALIGGLVLLSMPLYCRSDKYVHKLVWSGVVVGLILLAYAYIQKNFILTNMYYGGFLPQDWSDLVTRLQIVGFVPKIGSLLLNNLLLLGLSFAAPRLALVTLIVMLPNIVGNIGGAEKTGWLTHYHSYYFPILSFSAAVGFVNIYNKFIKNDAVHTFSRKGAIVVVVMVSIFVVHYKLVTEKTGMSPFASMKVAAGNLRDRLSVHPTGYAIRNNSVAMFRQGATVATDELGMALLHDHVSVSFFPVGAEEADYLFLPCQLVSDVPSATVNTLYSPFWLSEKGFDANSVEKIASIGYCRLTRIGRTGRLTSTAK